MDHSHQLQKWISICTANSMWSHLFMTTLNVDWIRNHLEFSLHLYSALSTWDRINRDWIINCFGPAGPCLKQNTCDRITKIDLNTRCKRYQIFVRIQISQEFATCAECMQGFEFCLWTLYRTYISLSRCLSCSIQYPELVLDPVGLDSSNCFPQLFLQNWEGFRDTWIKWAHLLH